MTDRQNSLRGKLTVEIIASALFLGKRNSVSERYPGGGEVAIIDVECRGNRPQTSLVVTSRVAHD